MAISLKKLRGYTMAMITVNGYDHSDHSSSTALRLEPGQHMCSSQGLRPDSKCSKNSASRF